MKHLTLSFLLLFVFLTENPCLGQSQQNKKNLQPHDSTAYDVRLNWPYFKHFWYDGLGILASPFHWQRNDFIKLGAFAAVGIGLYSQDQAIQDWVRKNKTNTSEDFASVVEPLGNGRYLLISSGVIYINGMIFKNQRSKRLALLILESQAVVGLLGQSMKYLSSRHRPRNDSSTYNMWDGPGFSPFTSFPSGHAHTIFAMATTIALEYEDKALVAPVAYTIAGLTSISRVHDDAHWASDVWVGVLLGYYCECKS